MGRKAFFGGKKFRRRPNNATETLGPMCALKCHDEVGSFCRICWESAPNQGSSTAQFQDREELIQPCGCLGSMTYVHPSCLTKWRRLCVGAAKNRCGVCLQPYTFPFSPGPTRWQQLACLIPTILSMLCICIVTCGATAMPQWPRVILGSCALLVLARYQSVTSLVMLLVLSSMLGLYIRGLHLVAQGDSCSRVCLAFSRHTPHGRCLPDSSLLYAAAALRKTQPEGQQGTQQHKQEQQQQEQQQQHHHHMQDEDLDWRWPDSSVVEEGLFECATCEDAEEDSEVAHLQAAPRGEALQQSLHAPNGGEGSEESCSSPTQSCASNCPSSSLSSLSFVWPASIMMRWGWL